MTTATVTTDDNKPKKLCYSNVCATPGVYDAFECPDPEQPPTTEYEHTHTLIVVSPGFAFTINSDGVAVSQANRSISDWDGHYYVSRHATTATVHFQFTK